MRAYGRADLAVNVPTPDAAVYRVGSVTKQFTAAAILQLAEQGKLALDDDVARYVPSFTTPGRHITLRHLLNHTSGIFEYLSLNGFLRRARVAMPHDSVVALFSAEATEFGPGVAMAYSNSGYFLLSMVIERVSGLTFEEYVQQNLFAVAGMQTRASARMTWWSRARYMAMTRSTTSCGTLAISTLAGSTQPARSAPHSAT